MSEAPPKGIGLWIVAIALLILVVAVVLTRIGADAVRDAPSPPPDTTDARPARSGAEPAPPEPPAPNGVGIGARTAARVSVQKDRA